MTTKNEMQETARMNVLFERVSALIEQARRRVMTSVNLAEVYTKYEIGRYIVEDEQQGNARAEYGKQVLKDLSVRLLYRLPFLGQAHHLVFIPAQCQPFVKAASHLTAELTDTPLLLCALYLVETAGIGVFDTHQDEVVGPRKCEWDTVIRIPRQCCGIWSTLLNKFRIRQFGQHCRPNLTVAINIVEKSTFLQGFFRPSITETLCKPDRQVF